ncbi:hypothetical protein STEG23_029888 [Scotinomys teguina]
MTAPTLHLLSHGGGIFQKELQPHPPPPQTQVNWNGSEKPVCPSPGTVPAARHAGVRAEADLQREDIKPDMVAHAWNSSTPEAEATRQDDLVDPSTYPWSARDLRGPLAPPASLKLLLSTELHHVLHSSQGIMDDALVLGHLELGIDTTGLRHCGLETSSSGSPCFPENPASSFSSHSPEQASQKEPAITSLIYKNTTKTPKIKRFPQGYEG